MAATSVIGKVLRGARVQGLIRYLYGPGAAGEHRDPHIVAGFRSPEELEPLQRKDGGRDFRRLDGLLTQPLALLGDRNYRKPVWHLPVRAAPEDPVLSDGQWAEVAREVMARTGLAPDGDDDAVRWIAVRHADDHIHIVATLARADGVRPEVWNDGYRVRDACRAAEARFGLRSTAPADRTAARRPKRAETEKAGRRGWSEPPRTALRRHVQTAAAGARNEDEFFAGLEEADVLVRLRWGRLDPAEVTGYAVALPDDLNSAEQPVWYGGGKLAADLTLPRLRRRWAPVREQGAVSGRHLSERSARAYLRVTVRQAADESFTPDEFFARLEDAGIQVRRRFSLTNPDQVTGYAVAPAGCEQDAGWYSGGRLAADLAFPRLQQQWHGGGPRQASPSDLTPEERQAFYDDAARATSYAAAQIRRYAVTNPHAVSDACWAASDVLHVAARATGNPHLRRAADAYDRAARAPRGRIPRATSAGAGLRTSARLLALAGHTGGQGTVAIMFLVANLVTLLDAVAQLHDAQRRNAQEAAARSACGHLRRHTQAPAEGPVWLSHPDHTPSPVELALADFPTPWAPGHARHPARPPEQRSGRGPKPRR